MVLHCSRRLITLLLKNSAGLQKEANFDLDECVQAMLGQPWGLAANRTERAFLVAPQDAADSRIERRLSTAGRPLTPVYSQTTTLTVCREVVDVPLRDVINSTGGGQKALWELAESLHSRIDVAWDPPDTADVCKGLAGTGDAAPVEPIEQTLRLAAAGST